MTQHINLFISFLYNCFFGLKSTFEQSFLSLDRSVHQLAIAFPSSSQNLNHISIGIALWFNSRGWIPPHQVTLFRQSLHRWMCLTILFFLDACLLILLLLFPNESIIFFSIFTALFTASSVTHYLSKPNLETKHSVYSSFGLVMWLTIIISLHLLLPLLSFIIIIGFVSIHAQHVLMVCYPPQKIELHQSTLSIHTSSMKPSNKSPQKNTVTKASK